MYTSFKISDNIKNQLRVGDLDGIQFEEVLFHRLLCRCNSVIQFKATDLNNQKKNVITLQFNDYALIKSSQLSFGSGNDRILGRGFDRYL